MNYHTSHWEQADFTEVLERKSQPDHCSLKIALLVAWEGEGGQRERGRLRGMPTASMPWSDPAQ